MKRFRWLFAGGGVLAATAAAALAAGGASATVASGLPTLTLALNGKSVVVGGSTVSGAVNVQTTVTGEPFGEALLFRLADGVSPSVFGQASAAVAAHHGDLNYLRPFGSIVLAAGIPKGTGTVQTQLAPGTYLALAPSGHGPPPHTVFTVTQSASPASLPTPGATEKAIDFGFTGPKTLHDGELVRFVNAGFVVHMDFWERVKSIKVAKKVVKLFLAGKDNAAGKLQSSTGGFTGPVSSGALQQEVITEKPGIYVQACFMNAQDGREHTQLGMERIIRIVK